MAPLLAATVAQAQLPEDIATRSIEIWSDGTRLAAEAARAHGARTSCARARAACLAAAVPVG